MSGPAPTSDVWNLFVEDKDIVGVLLVPTAFPHWLCVRKPNKSVTLIPLRLTLFVHFELSTSAT